MPLGESDQLSVRRPAVPDTVTRMRQAVVAFAAGRGVASSRQDSISLAVSEAVGNAVVHAYVERDEPGPVAVEAHVEEGTLIVLVSDEGCGMRPRLDSPGLGLGLPLIAQMTDSFEIEDREGEPGLRLRLRFRLT